MAATTIAPIALLKLPAWGDGVTSFQPLANRLWETFARAPASSMDSVITWLQGQPIRHCNVGQFQWYELQHELSQYVAPNSTEIFIDGRTLLEYQVLQQPGWPSIHTIADGTFQAFCEILKCFHDALGFSESRFRTQAAYTQRDRTGACTAYPGPEAIYPQLGRIYAHWKQHIHTAPGFAAVVAMTALLNVHPFNDGNGRVARLLFHWTINEGRDSPLYLPIHELSALSQYGYLIRLRQATYHLNWHPLFSYLLMCSERLFVGDGSHD
jgi:hypothetical protein